MPEVMEPDVLETHLVAKPNEVLGDVVRNPWPETIDVSGKYIPRRDQGCLGPLCSGLTSLQMFLQEINRCLIQGDPAHCPRLGVLLDHDAVRRLDHRARNDQRACLEVDDIPMEATKFTPARTSRGRKVEEAGKLRIVLLGCPNEFHNAVGVRRLNLSSLHPGRRGQPCGIGGDPAPSNSLLQPTSQNCVNLTHRGRRERLAILSTFIAQLPVEAIELCGLQLAERDGFEGRKDVRLDNPVLAPDRGRRKFKRSQFEPLADEIANRGVLSTVDPS